MMSAQCACCLQLFPRRAAKKSVRVSYRRLPMALQRINDTALWVEDTDVSGAGERTALPTIVFSHGLLFSTALFTPQVAALRANYRCVAYDHRGQGRSGASDLRSISIELLYQDAVALIESLNVGPVHFVGLSMGGFVGMRLAARRPDLVRSLTVLDSSADAEPAENMLRYRGLSAAARVIGVAPLTSRVMKIVVAKSTLDDPTRRADVQHWKTMVASNQRSIWRAVNGVIERTAIYPELGRIICPTLVIVGDEDVATVPAKSERIVAAIKGARLVRIPRAGHSSSLEAPAAVNQALAEFLGQAQR